MSAVPVWLWIVAVNLLAVVWFSAGEVKELQCESKRATFLLRAMIVLCAMMLGAPFWLATVLGEHLRRRGLAGRPPAPEACLPGFDAFERQEPPTAEVAARMSEAQALTRLRAAQTIGRHA